ncbi:leucine-rich repeat transmembrane protein FLRT3 [Dicentrarchus labrax]|uniref:LRRCT domain-containing protein n=1 Tax=Dicentrarchus labrax TaxID=13489 RepID=A0A8P4FZT3_DICLA|nr:leucine-rich repeat transmembrane protein FLRT3 [Dicentrarchus labrax]
MQLFILLFLLSHVAVVTAVVGCHSDRDKDHRPRENCTAAGFSDVPAGFEPSTKVLLFPNNLFSSVSWSSFQTFTDIYEIDFTGNKVPEVTSSVSPILPTLSVLRLGSNHIKALSDGSFTACPGLTELYLNKNALDSLSDHTFSGLSKLEILDLSSNRIKVLPELMLHPLSAIETLYLHNNKIKVMPDDWFSQKEEVPYLYLSENLWVCSCSLGYLRRYIDDYEFNIYVRDGPLIRVEAESVMCDSPQWHKGKPVMSLEESDLCSPSSSGPTANFYPQTTTYGPLMIPAATTKSPLPPTTAASTPATTFFRTTSTTFIPTTARAPSSSATAIVEELHTVYHRVVTWSRFIEWSDYSGSDVKGTMRLVELHTPTSSSLHTVKPSTESPVKMTTAVPTKPTETTTFVPSTVKPTTAKVQEVTKTTTIPSWVIAEPGSRRRGRVSAVRGAGVFCIWLFAGCLLLCVASGACILATLARMVIWYRRVYKPLSMRRRGGSEGVRILTYSRQEEKEVAGGGVMALYRSVLFIQREGGEAMEDGGKEGEERGGKERLLVSLEPSGGASAMKEEEGERGGREERGGKERLLVSVDMSGGVGAMREEEGERGGREERGVYRKTLYRLLSKEEQVEGWRDVKEECWVPAEDGGKRGKDEGGGRERSGGEVSRKSYSVILREEREEAGGGREEVDWVVGGWEVKRGGEEEEPRSSWGEWLAHYLPSMPWGVTTPPEGGAAQ